MANGNRELEDKQQIPDKKARKPYLKPAFRFEQVFVTTALSCGKVDPTIFLCKTNRSAS
jgi:hypothetical protein